MTRTVKTAAVAAGVVCVLAGAWLAWPYLSGAAGRHLESAERAVAESRYQDALADFEKALAVRAPARVRARIMEAMYEAGSKALDSGDLAEAVAFFAGIAAGHPRYEEAQAKATVARDQLLARAVKWLALKFRLTAVGGTSFEMTRAGVGKVELTVVGEADDGAVACRLTFVAPDGTRSPYPRELLVHPRDRAWFPAYILSDGRVLVEGVMVWRPPADPAPVCDLASGAVVEGWAVDPFEERVAAALLVEGRGGRTIEVVVVDLATGTCETADSYVPHPGYETDWPGQPVAMGWDGLVLHYERYEDASGEIRDWTADAAMRRALDVLAGRCGTTARGLRIEYSREGSGLLELQVHGEEADGALRASLSFVGSDGERWYFPYTLHLYPYSEAWKPPVILAGGRVLIDGNLLWTPPCPPESLDPNVSGSVQGWAVDAAESRVAVTFLVDREATKTFNTIVFDLTSRTSENIASYVPGRACPPDWPGYLIKMNWDGDTLWFDSYGGDRVEVWSWSPKGGG